MRMMFSQKLNDAMRKKKTSLCVGLDPRLPWLPSRICTTYKRKYGISFKAARYAITEFNQSLIDCIASLVPAVKLQSAFYEQYGVEGMRAFADTLNYAKKKELVVIADVKRGDIAATAQAYANAFLGRTEVFGTSLSCYVADAVTVNPLLGKESLLPFIDACHKYGKGIFILVKTSTGNIARAENIAAMVNECASDLRYDTDGYSAIGAVVALQSAHAAKKLRALMPHSFFLVPGYGTQGGDIGQIRYFLNVDGRGVLINSSRAIIFSYRGKKDGEEKYEEYIKKALEHAIAEIDDNLYA